MFLHQDKPDQVLDLLAYKFKASQVLWRLNYIWAVQTNKSEWKKQASDETEEVCFFHFYKARF